MTEQGLSQSHVARTVGVSPTCVGHWVRGETHPGIGNLAKLATKLGTTRTFLETGEEIAAISSQVSGRKAAPIPETLMHNQVVQVTREAREKVAKELGLKVSQVKVIFDFGDYIATF
jgi:transcriptional regulator with XRE-family HTH domain